MTQRRPNFGPIVYARAARPPGSTGLSAELRRQAGCPASSWSAPSTLTSTLTRPTVVKPASEILVKDHGGERTVESARPSPSAQIRYLPRFSSQLRTRLQTGTPFLEHHFRAFFVLRLVEAPHSEVHFHPQPTENPPERNEDGQLPRGIFHVSRNYATLSTRAPFGTAFLFHFPVQWPGPLLPLILTAT